MLAEIHADLNQQDQARQAYEELVERFPASPEATEARGELTP